MIKVSEVAKRLGFKYITVWSWMQKGKIRYYKINGSYRIEERDLNKLLKDSKREVKVK